MISRSTLLRFWQKHADAAEPLKAWYDEVKKAEWKSAAELKAHYRNASILDRERVVFNIKGNAYRLIVDVEYRQGFVFVVWLGSHEEYNAITAAKVTYGKTN